MDEQAAMADVFAAQREMPFECDICDDTFPASQRHEARQERPSQPGTWSSVMWSCEGCKDRIGGMPHEWWVEWAETNGYVLD